VNVKGLQILNIVVHNKESYETKESILNCMYELFWTLCKFA